MIINTLGQKSPLLILLLCSYITVAIIVIMFITGEWSAPTVKNRPSPCMVMAFTRISDHRAIMFGGNYQNGRSNDLFIFDLEHKVCTVRSYKCTLYVCACK